MLGFLLYGGSGTGELAEAGNGVRQWALCKISMKDSVGVVIWIPSALSPYDLLSAFRLRCTVHPQQGQPQPVGGGFQPGEPERSQLITVQTIWRSAFMFDWSISGAFCGCADDWAGELHEPSSHTPFLIMTPPSSVFTLPTWRPRRSKCLNLSFYPLFQDIFLVYWVSNSSCTEWVLLTIRLPVQVRRLLLVHEVD